MESKKRYYPFLQALIYCITSNSQKNLFIDFDLPIIRLALPNI